MYISIDTEEEILISADRFPKSNTNNFKELQDNLLNKVNLGRVIMDGGMIVINICLEIKKYTRVI